MKFKLFSLPLIAAFALFIHSAAYAAGPTLATAQMAEIILGMDGQPGKDAKMTLEDIVKDSSATSNEKQLATFILNVDKKIRPDDKPAVMKIWLSPSAAESERSLAKALLKFEEKSDDKVKAALSLFSPVKSK